MRRTALIATVLACAAGVGGWFALSASGDASGGPAAAPAPKRTAAFADRATTDLPPLPTSHKATVVEPVAGATTPAAPAAAPVEQAPPLSAPKPHGAASGGVKLSRPSTAGDGVHQATALGNGIALPPLEAPEAIRQMIEAGNVIARSPYVWGGGHGKWLDTGYDCSGSVSFVLASAGLLNAPLASGPLMSWGQPGPGKWVTIYSSPGHVYMEVAGVRFDTSGASRTGSRWQNDLRGRRPGFVARHPAGL